LVRFKWVQGGNSREIKTEESKKRRERGEYGKGGKERILSLMVEITGSLLVIGVEDTDRRLETERWPPLKSINRNPT